MFRPLNQFKRTVNVASSGQGALLSGTDFRFNTAKRYGVISLLEPITIATQKIYRITEYSERGSRPIKNSNFTDKHQLNIFLYPLTYSWIRAQQQAEPSEMEVTGISYSHHLTNRYQKRTEKSGNKTTCGALPSDKGSSCDSASALSIKSSAPCYSFR